MGSGRNDVDKLDKEGFEAVHQQLGFRLWPSYSMPASARRHFKVTIIENRKAILKVIVNLRVLESAPTPKLKSGI